MGKWLAKFLREGAQSPTDIPDTVTSVSGLSGGDALPFQEKKAEEKNSTSPLETKIPSEGGQRTDISDTVTNTKEAFQERSAIREFDGSQTKVEAELSAIEEVLPYLKNGDLIIPFNAPPKFQWWAGGQSILETLKELGASEETIQKYVSDKTGGKPKLIEVSK